MKKKIIIIVAITCLASAGIGFAYAYKTIKHLEKITSKLEESRTSEPQKAKPVPEKNGDISVKNNIVAPETKVSKDAKVENVTSIKVVEDPLIAIEKCKVNSIAQAKEDADLSKKQSFDLNFGMCLSTATASSPQSQQYEINKANYTKAQQELLVAKANNDQQKIEYLGAKMQLLDDKIQEFQIRKSQMSAACLNDATSQSLARYDFVYQDSYDRYYQACISEK